MTQAEVKISQVLREMGISPSIKGFPYLQEAISLVEKDPSYISGITKALYPDIAKKFNTTASRVERAIRHGIETGWDNGDAALQQKVFRNTISPTHGKPTNSQFIVTIIEAMKCGEFEEANSL